MTPDPNADLPKKSLHEEHSKTLGDEANASPKQQSNSALNSASNRGLEAKLHSRISNKSMN